MKIEKPWGYEELIYSSGRYVFKKLFMIKGEACSLQFHRFKHESVLVHSGLLQIEIGKSEDILKKMVLRPGETAVIEPGIIHRMSAVKDCVYFEASTPELDDVVRLRDLYGREDSSQDL